MACFAKLGLQGGCASSFAGYAKMFLPLGQKGLPWRPHCQQGQAELAGSQGVTEEIVLPAEQTCSLHGSEKRWLLDHLSLPLLDCPLASLAWLCCCFV